LKEERGRRMARSYRGKKARKRRQAHGFVSGDEVTAALLAFFVEV